jgi:hypothetical protein
MRVLSEIELWRVHFGGLINALAYKNACAFERGQKTENERHPEHQLRPSAVRRSNADLRFVFFLVRLQL